MTVLFTIIKTLCNLTHITNVQNLLSLKSENYTKNFKFRYLVNIFVRTPFPLINYSALCRKYKTKLIM